MSFQRLQDVQKRLRKRVHGSQRARKRRRFAAAAGLSVERLEERALLAALTVTHTDDTGSGSLRWAIEQANANAGADTIAFDIGTSDPGFQDIDSQFAGGDADPDAFVIQPASPLPALTDDGTTIDGRTQAGHTGNTNPAGPEIVLSGASAPSTSHGLEVRSDGSQIIGLNVQQFGRVGIFLRGDSNIVAGNYVGVDAKGTAPAANGWGGIAVEGSDNRIGTDGNGFADIAERNVVSGNGGNGIHLGSGASGNAIAGNYIGTASDGLSALGNARDGIYMVGAHDNFIGTDGSNDAFNVNERNVIAANGRDAIHMNGGAMTHSNAIAGNYLGVAADGETALGSQQSGVYLWYVAAGNHVGTNADGIADAAERNVISGHESSGIVIIGSHETGVAGNYVGTDAAGSEPVPNTTKPGGQAGIMVSSGSRGTRIGTNGDGQYDAAERNVISGNADAGVALMGALETTIAGNFIGTGAMGEKAVGNGTGVFLARSTDNVIGTDGDGNGHDHHERNVISGNTHYGVQFFGTNTNNAIAGNYIGTDISGKLPLGNRKHGGISLHNGASFNLIGTNGDGVSDRLERNVISANGSHGVTLAPGAVSNVIAGNFIGTDASGMTTLGNAASGVLVHRGAHAQIGTDGDGVSDDAEKNVISANRHWGVNFIESSDGVIAGNFIGVAADGSTALGNGGGIRLAGAVRSRIGADGDGIADNAERNVISANALHGIGVWSGSEHVIAGNFVGTAADGSTPRGNAHNGISLIEAANVRIGTNGDGLADGTERNVVSTNGWSGIGISGGSEHVVAGNLIGTDVTGRDPLGNNDRGIWISGATNLRIGTDGDGTADAIERNVISANGRDGIRFAGRMNRVNSLAVVDQLIARALPSTTATATVAQADLHDSVSAPATTHWNFDHAIPGGGGDDYAVVSTGTLQVNTAGTFTFALSGDDGGRLRIDGNDVIVDGALHPFQDRFGDITLDAGTHTFEWVGFEHYGAAGWELSVAAGGGRTGPIDAADGWQVLGDPNPVPEIEMQGALEVTAYYSQHTGGQSVIAGNYIGTDASGTSALGNAGKGIRITWGATVNTIDGNLISGNAEAGVFITGTGTDGNVVAGNLIGTNLDGSAALGNSGNGIAIGAGARSNLVGTNGDGIGDAAERNVISGNGRNGVRIADVGTDENIVAGNLIGSNLDGNAALANSRNGVYVGLGAQSNLIGTNGDGIADAAERNVISGNAWNGIRLWETGGNAIAGNHIGTTSDGLNAVGNGRDGISLGRGNHNRIGTDGDGVSDAAERNVVSGNGRWGVYIIYGSDNVIAGTFVGMAADGSTALGNGGGIRLSDAMRTRIGTDGDGDGDGDNAEGNVISANAFHGLRVLGGGEHVIAGNFIGTATDGSTPRGNARNGITLEQTIGARIGTDGDGLADATERNVISANGWSGVGITGGSEHVVAGNLIGTSVTGSDPLGNDGRGIWISGATDLRIGTDGDGTADAIERNVISANGADGIRFAGRMKRVNSLAVVDQLIARALPSTTATATVAQADLHDSVSAPTTTHWNFDHAIPGGGGDDYAVVSTGTLQVNTAGTFTFALSGDDGGRLRIDGNDVLVDDALHPFQDRFGDVTLAAGTHSFEWAGFERGGGAGWELSVAAGGGRTGPIDAAGGWKVLGDPNPVPEIELQAELEVTAYYSQHVGGESVIAGNFIGTDIDGVLPLPNAGDGVQIVGGSKANSVRGNLISGNARSGVFIAGTGTDDHVVAGNRIGTDVTGTLALGNGQNGVLVRSASNRIGTDGDGLSDSAERNVISANGWAGVVLYGLDATANVLAGNHIGTTAEGTAALGNGAGGVVLARGAHENRIGTDGNGSADPAERNLVSGNTHSGIRLTPGGPGYPSPHDNVIAGNFIGTDVSGAAVLGNTSYGIRVLAGADNRIGTNGDGLADAAEGNVIAGNGSAGVAVVRGTASGNTIRGNSTHSNGGLGTDLGNDGVTANDTDDADTGANGLQNFPVIQQAVPAGSNTVVTGHIHSTPSTTLTLDFYASTSADPSGYGEGERWLTSRTITTDAAGEAGFQYVLSTSISTGEVVTATATDPAGNTSEFSSGRATVRPRSTGNAGASFSPGTTGGSSTDTLAASTSSGTSGTSVPLDGGASGVADPAVHDTALSEVTAGSDSAKDVATNTSDEGWFFSGDDEDQQQAPGQMDEALAGGFDWLTAEI